jgi:signal transduction histidine kinase
VPSGWGHQVDATAFPQRLIHVLQAVRSRPPLPEIAEALARSAHDLVPADLVSATILPGGDWAGAVTAVVADEGASQWRDAAAAPSRDGPGGIAAAASGPIRLAGEHLDALLVAHGLGDAASQEPPLRGWLAVPILDVDGARLGVVQLTGRRDGAFTAADELAVVSIARVAATAVVTAVLVEGAGRAAARLRDALGTSDVLAAAMFRSLDGVSVFEPILDEGGAVVDLRYVFVNEHGERLLGQQGLLGRTISDAIPLSVESGLVDRFIALFEAGEPAEYEDQYTVGTDSVWYRATVVPVAGRLVVLFRDISEAHALQEQLLQAQKMEVVGRLAGGVAHDFNNLLTVVLGHAELARMELEAGEDPSPHVDDILAAAQRGADLTRRLLAFSRRQVLRPEVVVLGDVVEQTAPVLQRLAGADVRIVLRADRSRVRVLVDPGQLEQVLLNLVVNACDAMPGGGTLTVETLDEDVEAAGKPHDDGPRRTGPHAVLCVSDTGVGIDDAILPRVFEPFYTTKGPGESAGLGLSTVYGIVRQHGGHVELRTTVGVGTTVIVRLPALDESTPEGAAPRPGGGGAT